MKKQHDLINMHDFDLRSPTMHSECSEESDQEDSSSLRSSE